MNADQVQRDSFLVRIWRKQDQSEWQGWVQHISTGKSISIQDLSELKVFFENYCGELNKPPRKGLR